LAEGIVQRAERTPGVVAAGLTDIGINTDNNNNNFIIPPGSNQQILIVQYGVGQGYLDAMGLKLLAGRWFDANRAIDGRNGPYPARPAGGVAVPHPRIDGGLNQYSGWELGFNSPAEA